MSLGRGVIKDSPFPHSSSLTFTTTRRRYTVVAGEPVVMGRRIQIIPNTILILSHGQSIFFLLVYRNPRGIVSNEETGKGRGTGIKDKETGKTGIKE